MRRKMITFTSAAAMLAILAAGLFCFKSLPARGETTLSGVELLSEYRIGDSLDLSGAKLTAGGQTYRAEALLLLPDGTTQRGDTFSLGTAGRHTVKFQAGSDSTILLVKKSFDVLEPAVTLSGDSSSARVGADGMSLSLADGDKAVFSKYLDLTDVTAEDEIVKIRIDASAAGKADFTKLDLLFTDVENSDSYLKIRVQGYEWGAYALAGAAYQPLTGYEPEWDRLHKDNQWGSFFPLDFFGADGTSKILDIRYDSASKQVYSKPGYRIIDLDEPDFFTNVWSGFTSGKVKLTVSASGYAGSSANVTVLSLGGESIEDELYRDQTPPVVTPECDEDNLPVAVVGKPYQIFPAKALDDRDGKLETSFKVYLNYNQTGSVNVGIAGGAFTPFRPGLYTIVYTASDRSGNTASKPVAVRAVQNADPILIAVSPDAATSGKTGEKVNLAECTVTGGAGGLSSKVSVYYGSELVSSDEMFFLPEYAGEYEIVYEAFDYVGNTQRSSYLFTAEANNVPVLQAKPVLPEYFLKGKTYALPKAEAVDYSSGTPVNRNCAVTVSSAGKTLSGDAPVAMDFPEGTVRVTYTCGSLVYSVEIPVVDTGTQGSLDFGKFFACESGITAQAGDSGVVLTGSKRGGATFVRELISGDFSLYVTVDKLKNAFSTLTVTLRDYSERDRSVRVDFRKNTDQSFFEINGKQSAVLTELGFTSASRSNDFMLTLKDGKLAPSANLSFAISEYEDGRAFAGFPSGKVYLTVSFGNVSGASSVTVRSIGGQPLGNSTSDRIRPQIVLYGDFGGELGIGETVTLARAEAGDVLDPEITFRVSVSCPDGRTYAVSSAGVSLQDVSPYETHSFKVEQYGSYVVTYTAKDSNNGLAGVRSYTVICEDKVPPTVSCAVPPPVSCGVGESVALPEAVVSDNFTASGEIRVVWYLETPTGKTMNFPEGKDGFTASAEGTYKLVCLAYDGAGNMSVLIFEIKAVKK